MKETEDLLEKGKGPGKSPALPGFVIFLIEAFLFTQVASAVDFQSFRTYTPALSSGGDAGAGGRRDSLFDTKRSVERFQQRSRQDKENRVRQEEKNRTGQQTQEVEQNVVQEQRVSQAIAQQEGREADFITSRMDGLDRFSIDKQGGVWWTHIDRLVGAWNVFSQDNYGNASRSHLTRFQYNDLLNATGMERETVDAAGRVTQTSISGIAYMPGEAPGNFLGENKEASRTEVTTTFHPTGNQTTKTELYDLVYAEDKVVSQKAKITPLTNPNVNPLLQETFDMNFDGEGNVAHAQSRVTDLVTGTVTESVTNNQFSGNRLTSGVTESTTKDFINRTFSQQTSTQKVSYGESGIQSFDAKDLTTTRAMDDAGNPVDDYVITTETTQEVGIFAGIPEPLTMTSRSKTVDHIGFQTTEATQTQKHLRDRNGNLLGVTATEVAMTANFDRSVTQRSESDMAFQVVFDQPYLTGREERGLTKDLINNQDSTTTSHLKIQLDPLGRILGGTRTGKTDARNPDGSIVTDSTFTQYFDRADKVNALGLVRQESSSRTVNQVKETLTSRDAFEGYSSRRRWGLYKPVRTYEHSVTEEERAYTQSHDDVNRVLGAEEKVKSRTTTIRGAAGVKEEMAGETLTEGTVAYAVGKRTNQPYATSARNRVISRDPFRSLYTESTQTTTFESDENTGRAMRGKGVTESVSRRMLPDGRIIDGVVMILGRTEETMVGLEKANGFGMASRNSHTEVRDLLNGQVTDQDEFYTQALNGVGKIESAHALSRSLTQDLERTGLYEMRSLTDTTYRTLLGNDTAPIENRTVEAGVSHIDGSYRVAARRDTLRYDDYGRILPIDEENPGASGYEYVDLYDVTVQPLPENLTMPDELFSAFFGSGVNSR